MHASTDSVTVVSPTVQTGDVYALLSDAPDGRTLIRRLDRDGEETSGAQELSAEQLPGIVALLERDGLRFVWDDTSIRYPPLLAAGVRVARCIDLRLSHAILRNSASCAGSELASAPATAWDQPTPVASTRVVEEGLFSLIDESPRESPVDPLEEFLEQRRAVASSANPGALELLLAAESAGSLVAAEIRFAGLPWDAAVHRALLERKLGPRPTGQERPAKLEALRLRMREILQTEVNPDSPVELIKSLGRAGLRVESARSWDLQEIDHPVIAPLLEYKKLARLYSANGWHWLDTWIVDGRFHPEYVPGGVVTGRWGASGGGALQLPKQVRGAVIADPGWKLVVADASQLEPRVLAAMSGDRRMAVASQGDLYEGIVASGAVATRAEAKIAMLGAMYGSTTGESGRLMPRLARAFPDAIALVEGAARAGERGEIVSTRFGRSSPRPGEAWRALQGEASSEGATEADQRSARGQSRSWGRFTRNFVVQGTAAEWALSWMGGLRTRLWGMSGGSFLERPHLVYFLHDEVIVHAPAELAERVATEVIAAAAQAGRILFGATPVEFPVTTAIVDTYAQAK